MPDKNWQFELEEYIRQGEPDRAEKSEAWQTAIGLQAVDGLKTSEYLLDTAKDHIEGKITIDEAQKRIHSYYEQRTTRTEIENETKEADIVSARITKLLGEKAFQFFSAKWLTFILAFTDLSEESRDEILRCMSGAAESTSCESAASREFQREQLAHSHKLPGTVKIYAQN